MDIVIDVSAIVAVIVGEPERDRVVGMTTGHTLIGPGSIPWEIGNAFSAMFKQKRLSLEQARRGLVVFESVHIQYVAVDFANAAAIAYANQLYAYDAYFLDCATRHAAPLLTLDRSLQRAAARMGVEVIEV